LEKVEEAKARIEAALYAAGRPLSLEELKRIANLTSKRKTLELIREISKVINTNLRALEVKELNNQRFVLQLKPQFTSIAKRVSNKPLLSKASLKILAYIALNQPVALQQMVNEMGKKVYRHLKLLEEVGFVKVEIRGKSKYCLVTQNFSEYFGLSTEPEVMKKQLRNFYLKL